jgi:hypothetical protein
MLSHVLFGFKINDFATRDPITGKIGNVQSRNMVFPVDIIIGKESQALMNEHFGKYFKEIIRIC